MHRVGRTGRAGNAGTAYTFITPEEEKFAPDLVKAMENAGQAPPDAVVAMANAYNSKRKEVRARSRRRGAAPLSLRAPSAPTPSSL